MSCMADLVPISKEAFNLVSEQLQEVEQCARLENVLHLVKRLLRNTCALGQMLEQMESLMDFWQDFSPLTRNVVVHRDEPAGRDGAQGLLRLSAGDA